VSLQKENSTKRQEISKTETKLQQMERLKELDRQVMQRFDQGED
jgi:hypothetical protein